MADMKPAFIPGTQIAEPVSNNKYLYLEADIAFKRGDPCVADSWGMALKLDPDIQVGVWHAPMYAYENVPKGQFGFFLVEGASAAQKQGIIVRTQKKAEAALGINTQPGAQGAQMQEIKKIISKGKR